MKAKAESRVSGGKKNYELTYTLIAINILVFLVVFSMPPEMRTGLFENYSFSAANAGDILRWISSLFLHASASHLFFNMLGLFFFGRILEKEVKPQWYLAIFFVGGILGNFAFMMSSSAAAVGASACVFSLMGAAMLLNPVKRVHLYIFPLPLAFIAITFLLTTTIILYFQPEFGGVAHIAHLGGLLTGATFAFFYDPKRFMKGLLVLIICGAILIILGPLLSLITGFGSAILSVVDFIIGLALYSLASMLSFIWV